MRDVSTEPKRVGCPSSYTPELVSEICQRLANDDPLMSVCGDEDMPLRGARPMRSTAGAHDENAAIPVWAWPRMRAWMSWVPS